MGKAWLAAWMIRLGEMQHSPTMRTTIWLDKQIWAGCLTATRTTLMSISRVLLNHLARLVFISSPQARTAELVATLHLGR